MYRLFLSALIGFGLLGFVASSWGKTPSHQQPLKVVEAHTVSAQPITQSIQLIGSIRAKESTHFVAKTTGTFYGDLPSGTRAKKGQLIAHLDNIDLQKQVSLAKASEGLSRDHFERTTKLKATNAVSKQMVEQAETAWLAAQQQLAAAQMALDQAQFVAPFDGIVGVYKQPQGAQVSPGTPIVAFYNPNALEVVFDVPGKYAKNIQDNQSVYIENKPYHLRHIEKMIDTQTHMMSAIMDYADPMAIVGESISLELVIQQKPKAIVLPDEAVFYQKGKSAVYVIEDNQAALRFVTTGIKQKNQIEITEGLEVGEQIIVRGQARLYPYESIEVAKS